MLPVPPTALRLTMLGGFSVAVGSARVPGSAWNRRKAGSIVKLLALTPGHRLLTDQVLELLWPDLPPGPAANNLHRTLHIARRVLQPDLAPGSPSAYLLLRDETVLLTAPEALWIDVEAFEEAYAVARATRDPASYAAAIDCYGGDLLPQDRYEDWTVQRREELRGMYLGLLLDAARLHAEHSDYPPAIDVLKRAAAAEPACEEAHADLMRLYALSGQRRQALEQYAALTAALARELDAEPQPATQMLYRDIERSHVGAGQRISNLGPGDQPGRRATAAAAPEPEHEVALPAHNLPHQVTNFVGRDEEIAEVMRLLTRRRLVTLTGTGGGGKTRLALEVGGRTLHRYRDGVWLVDLSALDDERFVAHAVAQALGVQETSTDPITASLAEHLRSRQLLLMLDNCEHLADACARLAVQLLAAGPQLMILATSRQALGVEAEHAWPVPTLALPEQEDVAAPAWLGRYDAVRLFVERARSHRPGYTLTAANARSIARLCRMLDGLPLAIEMAAVHVRSLPAAEIAARLGDRLELVAGDRHTAAHRHRTMRATLDWSYELLGVDERAVFRHCSTFAGGWTVAGAEHVLADPTIREHGIRQLLVQLGGRSLVFMQQHGDETRYRFLEPVRQYASGRLAAAGEDQRARRRHAEYFMLLAEQAEPELTGVRQSIWLERMEAEHDNLRAALAWTQEHSSAPAGERAEVGLRTAGALWRFWLMRSHLSEGRRWLARALELPCPNELAPVRATALKGAGVLAYMQGDNEAAIRLYHAALELYRALDDRPGIVALLNNLGMVAHYAGDYGQAAARYEEALKHARDLDDRRLMAVTLDNLGSLAKEQGDYEQAIRNGEQSLALFRAVGDRQSSASLLGNLGNLVAAQGAYGKATALLEEGLAEFRALGDRLNVAGALQSLGAVAYAEGSGQAATLWEEALALSRDLGDKWGTAATLNSLARLAAQRGDHEQATALAAESLALHQELKHEQGVAAALHSLGLAAWATGDQRQALQWYGQSLASYDRLDAPAGVAECLERLAALAHPRVAARLLGAAARLREDVGIAVPPFERSALEMQIEHVRDALDRQSFVEAWDTGRHMERSAVVAEALELGIAAPARGNGGSDAHALSAREHEIARLIARGLTNQQIAAQLGISPRTADTHVGNILKKLGVQSRAEIGRWAQQQNG